MKRLLCTFGAVALLAGCGDGDVQEVRDWMKQVQRETVPKVKPLPEPKEFVPYAYNPGGAIEPFSDAKLLGEMARVAAANPNPLAPDANRPREVLENYPLDTMRMVGTLQKGGISYALLQIDASIYQVKAGQRIGQNHGLVTRISEGAIDIREVVQDATGDWVERKATIELAESKETGK
ncbi:pilus assembly protein PilP [Massilia sp. IC2-477]|uniref:pilus assembly protein PilP n=1 Tax=unclassified Massilia TaxID=2609279 RepID=UPI001D119586|nr:MULTISPECIES: pilus assembly protein PilP [unclassified Massilia]MCC2957881.1 pilus assembly protein PilP [Massilia sp. IC2-477]MCC2974066.1 pilus assembly protein PilP [Massilia sp. IC2-476]